MSAKTFGTIIARIMKGTKVQTLQRVYCNGIITACNQKIASLEVFLAPRHARRLAIATT